MAIGDRIKFLRLRRGFTQLHMGVLMGFPEKNAGVRIAQFESGKREPNAKSLEKIAEVLEVSVAALKVDDDNFLQTLFFLEDVHGLTMKKEDDKFVFSLPADLIPEKWLQMHDECQYGVIGHAVYDTFRYNYEQRKKDEVK